MIEIVPYNPNWPSEFNRIAADIRAALGDLALRIDHIGSTSVPGLAAKDIIDVQVTVADFAPPLVERFLAAGYIYKPGNVSDHRPPLDSSPDEAWEKRFFSPPDGHRPANIHVRIAGQANWRYALLFRDYLRVHPPMAEAYAELKRRLAHYAGENRSAYVLTKDPVCDLIAYPAEEWARRTGWGPGESD